MHFHVVGGANGVVILLAVTAGCRDACLHEKKNLIYNNVTNSCTKSKKQINFMCVINSALFEFTERTCLHYFFMLVLLFLQKFYKAFFFFLKLFKFKTLVLIDLRF